MGQSLTADALEHFYRTFIKSRARLMLSASILTLNVLSGYLNEGEGKRLEEEDLRVEGAQGRGLEGGRVCEQITIHRKQAWELLYIVPDQSSQRLLPPCSCETTQKCQYMPIKLMQLVSIFIQHDYLYIQSGRNTDTTVSS